VSGGGRPANRSTARFGHGLHCRQRQPVTARWSPWTDTPKSQFQTSFWWAVCLARQAKSKIEARKQRSGALAAGKRAADPTSCGPPSSHFPATRGAI